MECRPAGSPPLSWTQLGVAMVWYGLVFETLEGNFDIRLLKLLCHYQINLIRHGSVL